MSLDTLATAARYNAKQSGGLWNTHELPAPLCDLAPASPAFEAAVRAYQSTHGLVPDGRLGPVTANRMRRERTEAPPRVARRAWAWAGLAALRDPPAFAARAAACGLTDVVLVCQDGSNPRVRPHFYLYGDGSGPATDGKPATKPTAAGLAKAAAKLAAAAGAYKAAGLRVHLMTWLRPAKEYIAAAGAVLGPLCRDLGAASLMLDLEEPWVDEGVDYEAAAGAVLHAFKGQVPALGVTAIVHHDAPELRPVIALCDYVCPQAYATDAAWDRWKATPWGLPRTAKEKWGGYGKPIVMGVAAYDLAGAAGLSEPEAFAASLKAAAEVGCSEVACWQLEAMTAAVEGKAIKVWRGA